MEGYVSDLDKFVCTMPNQLKVVFTEEVVRTIYNTLSREEADKVIIDLLRYYMFGDDPSRFVYDGVTNLAFQLLAEKVGCFGRSMYDKDGDEDV